MTPTEQDKKLEVALMELFCRSEEFGRVFLTSVSKEEFAKSVNDGALDHQQAAHEAMQLITADRKRVALEARIHEIERIDKANTDNGINFWFKSAQDKELNNGWRTMRQYIPERIAELKAQQEEA